MGRLLTILLAIAAARSGAVLIDEVDSCFHYSVIARAWEVITLAARQFNTRIFATTHSWECLRAFQQTFSQNELQDCLLHRLDRDNGKIHGISYQPNDMQIALEFGMELR